MEPHDSTAILSSLALSGLALHPWSQVHPIISTRLAQSVDEFELQTNQPPLISKQSRVGHLIRCIQEFDQAPFTVQRLCEVLAQPRLYFRTTDSYLLGLEKLLSVSSTVPLPSDAATIKQLQLAYARVNVPPPLPSTLAAVSIQQG